MPFQGDLTNVVTDVWREWGGDFRSQIDTATNVAMDAAAMVGDPQSGLTVAGGDLVLASGYDLVVSSGDIEVTGNAIISGAITSGLVNGQTISAVASFTGSLGVTGAATLNGGAQIGASGTPLAQVKVYTPTLAPGTILASISAEQTFSVPGLTT